MHQKSLQRRIKCFKFLGWFKEALWYIEEFGRLYPEETDFVAKMNTEMKRLKEEGKYGFFEIRTNRLIPMVSTVKAVPLY